MQAMQALQAMQAMQAGKQADSPACLGRLTAALRPCC